MRTAKNFITELFSSTHKAALLRARDARIQEVENYQINISNYKKAIELAQGDTELQEFVVQLTDLLASAKIECKKAKIMLDVIESQL